MATTLIATIERAAREAEAGWRSVITGRGAAYIEDSALISNEYDTSSWMGLFLYLPASAAADQQRRVLDTAGYTVGAGRLSFAPLLPFGVLPTVGATYYATGFLPVHPMPGLPYSWEQAANEALRRERFLDEVSLGTGDSSGTYEFDVTASVPSVLQRDDVRRIRIRRTVAGSIYAYQDADKNGRYWESRIDEGHVKVLLYPPPSTADTVLVECARTYLEGDTDATTDATALGGDLALTAALVRAQVFEALNGFRSSHGKYQDELASALRNLEIARHGNAAVGLGT